MLLFINFVVSCGCYVHSSAVTPDPKTDTGIFLKLTGKDLEGVSNESSSISVFC